MSSNALYSDNGCLIEVVTPHHIGTMDNWLKQFIHWTDDPKDAVAIGRRGFDLKKCGRTAKKYRASERLWKYDPCGVYAIEYWDGIEDRGGFRPYVVFVADIQRALYINTRNMKDGASCGKQVVSEMYGGKTKLKLTKALLNDGFEAVFTDYEEIILNTALIEIVNVSGYEVNDD